MLNVRKAICNGGLSRLVSVDGVTYIHIWYKCIPFTVPEKFSFNRRMQKGHSYKKRFPIIKYWFGKQAIELN